MKSFLNFTGNLTIERNEEKLVLVPITLEKGSKGQYPGLNSKEFDLDRFIVWQCKNIDTSNDEALKANSFNNKVIDLFNELVFLPAWKGVVDSTTIEYDPEKLPKGTDGKKIKPNVVVDDKTREAFEKAFIDSVTDYFNGVTRSREKDSVYYRKEAERLAKLCAKETKPELKAELKLQAKAALQQSKQLEEQEKAQQENLFDEIFGDDDVKPTEEKKA